MNIEISYSIVVPEFDIYIYHRHIKASQITASQEVIPGEYIICFGLQG